MSEFVTVYRGPYPEILALQMILKEHGISTFIPEKLVKNYSPLITTLPHELKQNYIPLMTDDVEMFELELQVPEDKKSQAFDLIIDAKLEVQKFEELKAKFSKPSAEEFWNPFQKEFTLDRFFFFSFIFGLLFSMCFLQKISLYGLLILLLLTLPFLKKDETLNCLISIPFICVFFVILWELNLLNFYRGSPTDILVEQGVTLVIALGYLLKIIYGFEKNTSKTAKKMAFFLFLLAFLMAIKFLFTLFYARS